MSPHLVTRPPTSRRLSSILVASIGLVMLCGIPESEAQPPASDRALLDRRYDQVTVLMTHNAMSNRAEGWLFPNQNHGLTRQLKDGVRGLMLDVHLVGGRPHLVHSKSFLGKRPLVDGPKEIGKFLKETPRAVITIIFESYVDGQRVRKGIPGRRTPRLTPPSKTWRPMAHAATDDRFQAATGRHDRSGWRPMARLPRRLETLLGNAFLGQACPGLLLSPQPWPIRQSPADPQSLSDPTDGQRRVGSTGKHEKCAAGPAWKPVESGPAVPPFRRGDFYDVGDAGKIVDAFNRRKPNPHRSQVKNPGRRGSVFAPGVLDQRPLSRCRQYSVSTRFSSTMSATRRKICPPQIVAEANAMAPQMVDGDLLESLGSCTIEPGRAQFVGQVDRLTNQCRRGADRWLQAMLPDFPAGTGPPSTKRSRGR
ncbi:MAG: hypothetical protein CM1200mP2_48740 [Planctomycetaceae bacterium]|nr:MAG: hypothetical protein CM1200mP2_48740 [Planctomycetaceae bacterium]